MIICREQELERLQGAIATHKAEFLAIYGRRRTGKTVLVRHAARDCPTFIEVTGIRKGNRQKQIALFIKAITGRVLLSQQLDSTQSWAEVLEAFTVAIEAISGPVILFLDELPWLCAESHELLNEIDHFWNTRWIKRDHFKLIVCGSASAWIIEKILKDTGGLYNRTTGILHIKPFSLVETEAHLRALGAHYERTQILELYQSFGGIPYYHSLLDTKHSPAQNIQRLIFDTNSSLKEEYPSLLDALFRDSDKHHAILLALCKSRYGLSLAELSDKTRIPLGGALTRLLDELIASSFISEYVPFGNKLRGKYYRLIDEYTNFFLTWGQRRTRTAIALPHNYWLKQRDSAKYASWAGYSFEITCQKHSNAILKALGISGMQVELSSWRCAADKTTKGCQIDLILDRADRVVTLIEIKHSSGPVSVGQSESLRYLANQAIFKDRTRTRKSVNSVLITSTRPAKGSTPPSPFVQVLTLGDLFSS